MADKPLPDPATEAPARKGQLGTIAAIAGILLTVATLINEVCKFPFLPRLFSRSESTSASQPAPPAPLPPPETKNDDLEKYIKKFEPAPKE